MAKNLPKRKHTLRNILLVAAALPVLFILYLLISTLLDPVFDQIEKTKFDKLDQQSHTLLDQLKVTSGGLETWMYEAKCEPVLGGFKLVADFICSTKLTAEIPATSADQLNILQDKYYSVIDTSPMLKQSTELDKQLPNDFGKKFVVSSAEKHYTVDGNNSVKCSYIIEIAQPKSPAGMHYSDSYGSPIATSVGRIFITFECRDHASSSWYR